MMAWMLYATGVGVAFSVAAAFAEAGLRHPRVSAGRIRWVWATAMAATCVVPVVLGLAAATGGPGPAGWLETTDTLLLLLWAALSLALLANMRLSAWTVERNTRSWQRARSRGEGVLISSAFGPGVVGVREPKIVLPEWAIGADEGLVALIVAHEVEHVRAGDTRLLLAGVVLVALVPWSLPLWWQLHRLRGAIETDCDGRVLQRNDDARAYAEALVAVAGRRGGSQLAVPALSPGRGELERRIRQITAGPARSGRGLATTLILAATAAAATPALVPAPDLPRLRLQDEFAVDAPSARPAPRGATVILSVAPEAIPARVD